LANVIHSTLTYNANLSPAQAQIKALTGQIATLTTAFNALDKSAMKTQATLATTFMASAGQIGGFTTQMVKTNTAVDDFGQAIARNRLTMRQYFREAFAGYAKQNSMMKKLAQQQVMMQQSMLVPLGAGVGGAGRAAIITPTSLDALSSKSAMAAKKFSIFNELIDGGSTRMLNFGKNTQWTGRQLMVGFTLPLIMFTALVSKQFREIDKELTRFEKVYGADLATSVEGATKKMREQVEQLAYDISAAYGIAAKDTAALAADIAQTGKEGQALLDSIRQTTRLSVLGEVERQEAMQATLSIQNAFKLNTNELAESIDFLNAVENQTSTNLQDLAGAIPRVGPVIQSLNGDIKDMSLLLVAMREGGVAAGEAANALKSGLGRLINPTRQAREAAASFGISLEDIISNSRGQLIPMVFELQDALAGLDDFARAQVIEKLFGKYQFARMSALFANLRRQGSQTLEVMELASASSTELAKIANQELATLQQSSAMRFQRTVETLKNSLLPLGEVLTESMIPILSGIGNAIRSFMDFFSALPGPIKDFTKFAVVVTALAGPVVMLVGLFGNLAANGIKFLMGLTRIGAKLMGMKVDRFELLTRDVMAAQLGVDGLTTSFMEQDVALRKLSSSLTAYAAQLRQTLMINPSYAVAGAPIPGRPPIRRQAGSRGAEFVPGSGRGDKIPAMLEPGEFVVNRAATEKFAPILVAMNRGNVQGFVKGTQETHLTGSKMVPASALVATGGLAKAVSDSLRLLGNQMIQVFSNLVVSLPSKINQDLRVGQAGVPASTISGLLKDQQTWSNIMKNTGLTFQDLQPVIKSVTGALDRLDNELINDPKVYQLVEASLATLGRQGDRAAQVLQILSNQYGTFDLKRRQIDDILRQGGSPVIKETGQRERLGVGVAPSYTTPLTGRGQLLQNKPYMDLMGGGKVAPGSVPIAQELANVQKQELGLAQRRVTAAKSLQTYQDHREKLLTKINISERHEALLREDLIKITRDSKIPLDQKIKLQQELNKKISDESELRKRINVVLARLETDIKNASNRMASLGGPSAIGRGPGGSAGYLSGGASPYAPAAGAAVPLWLRERMREANANAPKRVIRGQTIGPDRDGMQMGGPRGQGLMNAAFMSTMLISSFSMMGGASNDLAIKLGLLSTAVMTATMAMQMFAGKNVAGNFLGLGSLGNKVSSVGAARQAAANAAMLPGQALIAGPKLPVGAAAAGGMSPLAASKGAAGAGLLRMGGMLSMLGGPVGMAAAGVAVAGVTAFIMYQKAAEEARERAMSAFADPTKTAEYFGIAVEDVTEKLKAVSSAVPGIEEVDQNLRTAVKEDYATLIEKIRFGGAEAGGRELGIVFNKMLASGLSKEQAEEAIKAIAIESGAAGGVAFASAMRQGMFSDKSAAEIARSTADMFNPEKQAKNRAAAQQTLTAFENEVGVLGRVQGTMAQNFDNTFGDILTGAQSFAVNINPIMKGIRAVTDFDMFERMFDKDANQEFIDNAANTERQVHQMQTNIEEMADVSADSIVKITEVMYENFKKAPRETIDALREIQEAGQRSTAVAFDPKPIKDFITEIDPINGIILNALIGQDEELATKVMEGITAGMSVQEIIDALTEGGVPSLEVEVELKVREQEIQVQIDELRADLKEDLVIDLDLQISEEEEKLEGVNKQLERMDKFRARHEGVLKKDMNRLNRASESAIEGMNDEIDLIRERADARKEEFDEKIDNLNKEKEEINNAADAYVDSLRKRERADSFYSNQRKTAFSALQKLAAGDVFGFLQDREQMSADAQTFAYDNMIQGIDDKRDREIEAIDETIEKEQERQEKYEKNVENRIELIQDQIDAEEELMDQRQKDFDREMRFFDRREKRRRIDLDKEKREVQVSLDQLRATRQAAESGQIQSQKELSDALGKEKAKPYFEEQKAIVKTEMMKKYIEMKDKYPDESDAQLQMRSHGELIDLFNALYGVTPGQGRRPTMGWAGQLEDIGFTPNFNTGGPVNGPGTQTSDSIPAMLSNGEYVVRASSVSKYGKSMMDTINAGKFNNGGYVSADQAERQATGKYLGGVKPKQTYTGGTPTYSGGYGSANTQATQTSGYKKKIWDQPTGRKKTGSGGFLGDLIAQGFRSDFADFISGMAPEEYRNIIGMNLSGDRNYGQRAGWEKALGSGLFATTFLPGLGLGLKGATALGKYLPKLASAYKGSRFASDRGSIGWMPGGVGGDMVMRQGLLLNKTGRSYWMGEEDDLLKFKATEMFNEDDYLTPGAELHILKPGASIHGNISKDPIAQWMASHKNYGSEITLLMSLAAREVQKRYGVPMVADSSLSERAYKFVEKLVGTGLIKWNPEGTNINSLTPDQMFEHMVETPRGGPQAFLGRELATYSQPNKEEVELARQFLRESLRNSRLGKISAVEDAWSQAKLARMLREREAAKEAEREARRIQYERMMQIPPDALYAKGGLVGNIQKFAEGGMVGPNGWPHLTSYDSNLLATKNIPGTQISLRARKEVLPLFLAIASEYNKRIRKIDPSQSAAFDLRLDRPHDQRAKSNHPSGTAMDINWSNEGAMSSSEALYNWWAGRKSPGAPWGSISNVPASDAKNIKNRFNRFGQIIEWYGSSRLGGDFLGSTPDWMHWQISQVTKPGPDKVKEITRRLGIDDEGLFDGSTEEGEGKPGRGGRPRKGSNGTGAGGRYMPSSGGYGALDPSGGAFVGKAMPNFLSAIQLPGKDTSGKPGGKPGGKEDKPDNNGDYRNQYIKGSQLVKLLHATGFRGTDLRTAYGVVMGESGGNRKAVNNNGSNKDWGLFQMNDYWNRNIVVDGKKADFSPEKIFDAQYNSRFALATTKDPGVIAHWKDPWKDWNAYSNNTPWYQKGLKDFDNNPQWRKHLNLNAGGPVIGPGGPVSDSIPAMLSNGEYVIRADSARKYGKSFLDKLNSGQLGSTSYANPIPEMAMAAGGMVGFSIGGVSSPSFNMPNMNDMSNTQVRGAVINTSNSSTSNNSNNVKIVINGAGKNANAIANKVAKMLNSSNNARNHSRSTN
jgi:TP901 family phage tail tape measure protein